MPEESRQSLFQTGREIGKRDKAVLALSPLYPSASAPGPRSRGGVAEECEPQVGGEPGGLYKHGKTTMYGSLPKTETSPVELIP
jgi:hypothetical protein